LAQRGGIESDSHLLARPAVQDPSQPGSPAGVQVEFGALLSRFGGGLAVGVTQAFADRVEGLSHQRRQGGGDGSQAAGAGDDHAEAPQSQAGDQGLAQVGESAGDGGGPLIKSRMARHGVLRERGTVVTPSSLPKQPVSPYFLSPS